MKLLIPILLALFLIACDNDSSTSANNSNDDEKSSKSSSSVKMTSSSSVVILGSTENLTDSRDGQTYKTVTIGSQTWMAQNLNYKAANSVCYESSAENCEKYGRLYLWSASSVCPKSVFIYWA